jgi:hypothetical protein
MFNRNAMSTLFIGCILSAAGCESGGGSDGDDDFFVRTPETTTGQVDERDNAPTGDNVFDQDGLPGDNNSGTRGTRDGLNDDEDFLRGGSGGVGGHNDTGGGTGPR